MTKDEVGNAIHSIIQDAVQRSKGNWRHSYKADVDKIFAVMGKLAPEPKAKPEVTYDPAMVRKVCRQKFNFTEEQRSSARSVLRKLGII